MCLLSSRADLDASSSVADSANVFAHTVADTLASGGAAALAQYDGFPAPIYAIAASGHLVYYNKACLAITGRTPRLGIDQWCVAAAVLTLDGVSVDFATGPMATALRDALPLRNIEALVERPDGERVAVRIYPTPAIDDHGQLCGAINLLVPLDGECHRELRATALRCRSLAKWISDRQACEALDILAIECDEHADVLRPG